MVTGQSNTGIPDASARRCLNTLFLNLWFTARSGKKDAFCMYSYSTYTLPHLKSKEHGTIYKYFYMMMSFTTYCVL
jgi:hypothetical protein